MVTSQPSKGKSKEKGKTKGENKKDQLYDDRSNKEAEREAQPTSGGRGPTEGDPAMGINYLAGDHPPERSNPRKTSK